jgi:hypothetical protein
MALCQGVLVLGLRIYAPKGNGPLDKWPKVCYVY